MGMSGLLTVPVSGTGRFRPCCKTTIGRQQVMEKPYSDPAMVSERPRGNEVSESGAARTARFSCLVVAAAQSPHGMSSLAVRIFASAMGCDARGKIWHNPLQIERFRFK